MYISSICTNTYKKQHCNYIYIYIDINYGALFYLENTDLYI